MQFFQTHEAALAVATAWASREWQQLWPQIKLAFPYCRDNGGVFGLIWQFFFGRKEAVVSVNNNILTGSPVQQTTQQPLTTPKVDGF